MKEGFQYFEIRNIDTLKLYNLINSIRQRLKQKKDIVNELQFSQLINLLRPFMPENYSKTFEKGELITNEVIDYCKKEQNYDFLDESNPNDEYFDSDYQAMYHNMEDSVVREYMFISLRLMVSRAVHKAINYLDTTELSLNSDSEKRKLINEFIKVIYDSMQKFKIAYLNKTLQKQMTHYKLTVITGLILIKLQPKLLNKFKDVIVDNNLLRPDEIKAVIAPYSKKYVKNYLLKK